MLLFLVSVQQIIAGVFTEENKKHTSLSEHKSVKCVLGMAAQKGACIVIEHVLTPTKGPFASKTPERL